MWDIEYAFGRTCIGQSSRQFAESGLSDPYIRTHSRLFCLTMRLTASLNWSSTDAYSKESISARSPRLFPNIIICRRYLCSASSSVVAIYLSRSISTHSISSLPLRHSSLLLLLMSRVTSRSSLKGTYRHSAAFIMAQSLHSRYSSSPLPAPSGIRGNGLSPFSPGLWIWQPNPTHPPSG